MWHYHPYPGLGWVVLGLLVTVLGVVHHFCPSSHHARFEQHVAKVCVQAAKEVQK